MGSDQQGKKDEQGHVEVFLNRESELINANLNLTLTGINEKVHSEKKPVQGRGARFCYCITTNIGTFPLTCMFNFYIPSVSLN
jgi:hypothetical protein